MPVDSMDDVMGSLQRQLDNDLALGPLCTRLMLRTGVNLRSPRPDQALDKALIGKVVATLSEMGYKL